MSGVRYVIKCEPVAEMTPVAVLLSVAVLLPRLVAILSSELEILPTMNLLIQSEKLFHFNLGAIYLL